MSHFILKVWNNTFICTSNYHRFSRTSSRFMSQFSFSYIYFIYLFTHTCVYNVRIVFRAFSLNNYNFNKFGLLKARLIYYWYIAIKAINVICIRIKCLYIIYVLLILRYIKLWILCININLLMISIHIWKVYLKHILMHILILYILKKYYFKNIHISI